MDRLWWENITNTSHFIDQIVEAVQSGSHLFLQLPQFVPWYETMSDLVISKIERQNSDRSLKIIIDSQTQTVYNNTISIYFLLSYIFKILLCVCTNLKIYAFQNQSKKQDFQEKELLKTPATEQEDDAY